MLIPQRGAKEYGVVHIDNYIDFIGFCKDVNSDKICDVDVFANKKLIATIKADKNIEKIEKIYNIKNHGFLYKVDKKYFEKPYIFEFKTKTNEELLNSKIKVISKDNPSFDHYVFLHSLVHLDKDKIKNLYQKNNIGFFIDKDFFKNQEFIDYIKELIKKIPYANYKIFYTFNGDKTIAQDVFKDEIDSIELIKPKDIYELANNLEIFIAYLYYEPIVSHIKLNNKNLYVAYYTAKDKCKPLGQYSNDKRFEREDIYGYSKDEVKKENGNYSGLFYKKKIKEIFGKDLDFNQNAYDFFHFDMIEYVLKSEEFKEYEINTIKKNMYYWSLQS